MDTLITIWERAHTAANGPALTAGASRREFRAICRIAADAMYDSDDRAIEARLRAL